MTSQHLKTMFQDIINDRPEQARAAMHEYFIAKSRELTEGKISNRLINRLNPKHSSSVSSSEGQDLEGSGSSDDEDYICDNGNFTSFRELKGMPKKIRGHFYGNHNRISSINGAPKEIAGNFSLSDNNLSSLEGIGDIIKYIGGEADFSKNPIKSHVLGLLKIKGLDHVYLDNSKVEKIINKHLSRTLRDVEACKQDLIYADLDDFAQL